MNDDKLRALASGTRLADLEVRKAILRVMDERDAARNLIDTLEWQASTYAPPDLAKMMCDTARAFGEGKQ